MSATWLSALRDFYSDRVVLVGLVDLYETAAQAKAGEFALEIPTSTSLEGILREVNVDVVFNCTIPEAHFATCETALRAGCHVLVEKPIAPTVAEARQLQRIAAEAGRTLAVIQNRRYLPGAVEVKRLLQTGIIGPVTALHADFFLGPHFGGFRETMRHPLLHDMAIHTFDQCRFLAGSEAQRVTCVETNPPGSWFANGASATAIFEMKDGSLFSYRGSWCARGFPTSWAGAWRILGEQGTLLWDGEEKIEVEAISAVERGFFDPTERRSCPLPSMAKSAQEHAGNIGEFLHALDTGTLPQTEAADNVKSLAMVEAAVLSAENRQPMETSQPPTS
jgi:predicted dehydrogenase